MLQPFLTTEINFSKSEYENRIELLIPVVYTHMFYFIMFSTSTTQHNTWKKHLAAPLLRLNGFEVPGTKSGKPTRERHEYLLFTEMFINDLGEPDLKKIQKLASDTLQDKKNVNSKYRTKSLQIMGFDSKFPAKKVFFKIKDFLYEISLLLSTSNLGRDNLYKLIDEILLK